MFTTRTKSRPILDELEASSTCGLFVRKRQTGSVGSSALVRICAMRTLEVCGRSVEMSINALYCEELQKSPLYLAILATLLTEVSAKATKATGLYRTVCRQDPVCNRGYVSAVFHQSSVYPSGLRESFVRTVSRVIPPHGPPKWPAPCVVPSGVWS